MRGAWLAALVFAGSIVHAQQPPPTFRASVHLIVQPVSVKDKQGRPVEGLTAKDFVVTEDGRPQQIAFVEFQRLAVDPPAPADTPPATVPPVTAPDLVQVPRPGDVRYRGRRLLVFYFDLYGMPFFDQGRVFAAARTFISTRMTPADLVSVMVFEGRGPRLKAEFTGDRDALLAAVGQLETEAGERDSGLPIDWDPGGGAFGDDDDTFNLFTADRQLAALQTAVSGFAPLPELKTLVYFGSGLRANGADNLAQLRATVNAAVRANVTLNPIDARGLVATAPLGDATRPSPSGAGVFSGALAQAATTRFQQSQDTLYALAKDTGGTVAFDTNDLAFGIVKAAQAVTGYYLIGYYTDNAAADGRYRRVKVGVSDALGAIVSSRPGYYAGKIFEKFNAADKERQLADALRLEDPVTEIPMAMEVNYFQLNAAEYFVPVSVRMPRSELTRARGTGRVEVDMIGELKDEFGVTQRNVRDVVSIAPGARAIQYETAFTILPGRYVLKVLARNNSSGRLGTFQTSFTVPNLERERERLPTSSVVLSAQRVAAGDAVFTVKQKVAADRANPLAHDGRTLVPSVTRTFSARQPLFVFLEAYEREPSAARALAAFVAFYRDGVKVFETEPEGVPPKPQSGEGGRVIPIRLQVPLTRLTPGRYECQVTVLDPSGARASFWRAPIAIVR